MRDTKSWILLIMAGMVMAGCGSKQEEKQAWAVPAHETVVRRMPDYALADSLRVGGHEYRYEITRLACDSLPKVKDDMDDLFADNTIRLSLQRDGRTYFDRTFDKATFANGLDAEFFQHSILDGIRFMHAEPGQGLTFSFTVSYPESDMSVPFLLTIADNGTFSFVKDENLDREEGDSAYYSDDDGV